MNSSLDLRNGRRVLAGGVALAFALLAAGCQTNPLHKIVLGPDYQPGNIYRSGDRLPEALRRVAVLPITFDDTRDDSVSGAATLEPVLHAELSKCAKLELVQVSPEDLGRLTGQRKWDADEKLPPDFFKALQQELSCDAVLFCRLSAFRAYPPLAVGWKMKLVESTHLETVWAIDEVFDSGDSQVVNSARRYENQHQKGEPDTDTPMILTSPLRFGQYTAWAVVHTMPAR